MRKGGTWLGLSKRSDKQRTRLILHCKYAPEEKIVIESEKSWIQNKGVVFEVSNGNMSKRNMKKAATRLFEFKFLKSAKRKQKENQENSPAY